MTTEGGDWAPIALFIYKRPDHARRMIASLMGCSGFAESRVFVFADGPAHARDLASVRETRSLARAMLGDRAVFVESETNLGVDNAVIGGVTHLCDRFGKVVVIEDDLVLSPLFLDFMNRGLRRYEGEAKVMQVSGYMFDVPELRHSDDALFLPITTSWGWATWKRAWDRFDPLVRDWKARLNDGPARRRFDLDGHFAYSTMLARQMQRRGGAWDIRWYYSVFAGDGLVLFPPRSLVINRGFDGTGTHDRLALPAHQAALEAVTAFDLPADVVESPHKEDVFRSIGAFRPTSARRRLSALMKVALRRGGLA